MNDITHIWTTHESPLGTLTLVGGDAGLTRLLFPGANPLDESSYRRRAFEAVSAQLDEYFAGARRSFDVNLDLSGTPFQHAVWERLRAIPYGVAISYSDLAGMIGRPDRVRAVGGAVGRTPVPIIVPCHRVIGADGSLTGYGGGLARKRALLDLEGARYGRRDSASARPPSAAQLQLV